MENEQNNGGIVLNDNLTVTQNNEELIIYDSMANDGEGGHVCIPNELLPALMCAGSVQGNNPDRLYKATKFLNN